MSCLNGDVTSNVRKTIGELYQLYSQFYMPRNKKYEYKFIKTRDDFLYEINNYLKKLNKLEDEDTILDGMIWVLSKLHNPWNRTKSSYKLHLTNKMVQDAINLMTTSDSLFVQYACIFQIRNEILKSDGIDVNSTEFDIDALELSCREVNSIKGDLFTNPIHTYIKNDKHDISVRQIALMLQYDISNNQQVLKSFRNYLMSQNNRHQVSPNFSVLGYIGWGMNDLLKRISIAKKDKEFTIIFYEDHRVQKLLGIIKRVKSEAVALERTLLSSDNKTVDKSIFSYKLALIIEEMHDSDAELYSGCFKDYAELTKDISNSQVVFDEWDIFKTGIECLLTLLDSDYVINSIDYSKV